MSRLVDRCSTSPMTTTAGGDVDNNQEEELCNQFAAMPSPSRKSQQKHSADEDGKSLGKCSDDNTTSLHDMIASALIGLQKPWNGHLLLRCSPMTLQDIKHPNISGEPVDDINICDYLSGKKKEYVRLNFSPSEYPPSDNPFERANKVWTKLKKYIEQSSFNSLVSDSPVVCTAGAAGGMGKKFACQVNNDSNKKSKSEKRTDVDFRQTYLVNDGERGERPNGRALPRKTSCQDVSKGTCGFSFTVKCDQLGYHIRLRQNDVTGPTLPMDLLTHTVMPVEEPTPETSAIQSLKNYEPDDVSEYLGGNVDGCIVSTYFPESLLNQLGFERAMLQSNDEETIQDVDHAAFSQSLEDYEFGADGSSMPAGVNTRSALNPLYQEACNYCDQNPQLQKLLADALEGIIQQGRQLENEKLPASERNGKTVSMSTSKYKGPPRVENTKHYR